MIKPKKNPVTKLISAGVKAAAKSAAKKANARGLKAANKPTNKTGSKADRRDRETFQGNSNLIKNADPARPNRVRGGSLYAIKTYGGQGLVSAKKTPKQTARQAEITKELNPVRKKAKVKDTNTKVSSPKSAVKVKTAAKQRAGKKDIMTVIKKRAVRNEQINEARKGDDFINSGIRQGDAFSRGKTKLMRQVKASKKSK